MNKEKTWADNNRPMRVFEKVLNGGLGAGNIGVVMSRHGTGKAAVLASITIDQAMSGTNCLHVAYGQGVADVRAFDDEILHEIAKSLQITDKGDLFTVVERRKQIYTYQAGELSPSRLRQTLEFLSTHAEFRPGLIFIQGWPDFKTLTVDELRALKGIAVEYHTELWMAAHTSQEDFVNKDGVPDYLAKFMPNVSVLVKLEPKDKNVQIKFVKTHDKVPPVDPHLEFDPSTMLVRWQ